MSKKRKIGNTAVSDEATLTRIKKDANRLKKNIVEKGLGALREEFSENKGEFFLFFVQAPLPDENKEYVLFLGKIPIAYKGGMENRFPNDRVKAIIQENYRLPTSRLYKKSDKDDEFVDCIDEDLFLHAPQKMEREKKDYISWKLSDLFLSKETEGSRAFYETRDKHTRVHIFIGDDKIEQFLGKHPEFWNEVKMLLSI